MTQARRTFLIFSVLLGIFYNVCCENYSVNPFNFQLNKKAEFESIRNSKENIFENPPQKNIHGKRRMFFNEGNANDALISEREENNNEYSDRRRTNISESENEKILDWDNVRFQSPVNTENLRNFGDFSVRQPFLGIKSSNHRSDWEKSDFFEKNQFKWNKEKNFKEFSNQNPRAKNHYNGKFEEVINDTEMNKDGRRGDIFEKRVSITTLNDGEEGNMKNYNSDRVGHIHSHSNHHNRNPNSFWNPTFFKPEKEVVINLKTECSTPRQFNNQLVHKFIFTPRTPIHTHSEYSGFQIPEPGYISSHKMTPMYYL